MKLNGLLVQDSKPARVKGWELVFNVKGIPLVHPGRANAIISKNKEEEIHGIVYAVPRKDILLLDNQNQGFHRVEGKFQTYDDKEIDGFIFTAKKTNIMPR